MNQDLIVSIAVIIVKTALEVEINPMMGLRVVENLMTLEIQKIHEVLENL